MLAWRGNSPRFSLRWSASSQLNCSFILNEHRSDGRCFFHTVAFRIPPFRSRYVPLVLPPLLFNLARTSHRVGLICVPAKALKAGGTGRKADAACRSENDARVRGVLKD